MQGTSTGDRTLTEARKRQGFGSQAHLDSFYRHHDHVAGCDECGAPGPSVWIDDGYQPTGVECDEAARLHADLVREGEWSRVVDEADEIEDATGDVVLA